MTWAGSRFKNSERHDKIVVETSANSTRVFMLKQMSSDTRWERGSDMLLMHRRQTNRGANGLGTISENVETPHDSLPGK